MRTLVVVHVPGEHDIHAAVLEDVADEPHLLLAEVRARRVERRVMKDDELPRGVPGGREIPRQPVPQVRVRPVDVDVRVDERPVRVAVVERVVRHAWKGGPNQRQVGFDSLRRSFNHLRVRAGLPAV